MLEWELLILKLKENSIKGSRWSSINLFEGLYSSGTAHCNNLNLEI